MERRQQRVLTLLLGCGIALGCVGTYFAVQSAQATSELSVARAADVEANARLIREVQRLQTEESAQVRQHRERNELLHAEQCAILLQLAKALGVEPMPCDPPILVDPGHSGDELAD